ncbi:MAG TPA: permease, partial [Candidatus Udaeobacter sp.]|nr:permease [Candidatus Udaeobacter sp.]
IATLLGAASSSCSYAAVAVARSLFRKGAAFSNAILFEFASTNLVFELGLVLLVLLGWQFVAAEFAGGLLMIAILALAFKYTLRAHLVEAARAQLDRGLHGKMEGHGEMDHSITDGPFLKRLFSDRGLTAISHNFYMDVASIAQDLAIGMLIAGALAAWVPDRFWQALFFTNNPAVAGVWGPVVGPVISMLSFVCSVGNVPLAVVLWNGGISFGGVISFIFADLIILPILDVYRKYYGRRMTLYLLAVSYVGMVIAGLVIGGLFNVLGLTPAHHYIAVFQTHPSWNYTTVLNIVFLAVAAFLGWRFLRTGGLDMLRAMEQAPEPSAGQLDPVCGMTIDPETAAGRSVYRGETYYFCSTGCKAAFDREPDRFVARLHKT